MDDAKIGKSKSFGFSICVTTDKTFTILLKHQVCSEISGSYMKVFTVYWDLPLPLAFGLACLPDQSITEEI